MTTLGKHPRSDEEIQNADPHYKQDALIEPEHEAYSDENKAAKQTLSGLLHELLNISRSLLLHLGNEHIGYLIQQLEAASVKPEAEKPTIAICGLSGAGKSAFIICLLDVLNLTRSISSGSSVTCLPTTYKQQLPGQTLHFAADIESMTDLRLATLFRELISHIRRFYVGQASAASANWTPEEEADYEERAGTSLKMILVSFDGKEEWSSKDKIIERCSNAVSDANLTALMGELVEYSKATLIEHGLLIMVEASCCVWRAALLRA
ncbi:uncharacterized protein MYCFIDRAFT_196816 [Pseudocercospora fijiensis CIRAD86]|uniref:Uncharacterized protein n=1 Tax=Pseudocercospora fijiensis (strain CIRAD86) TaxID=383855 RepID=M3AG67_PSEFD|nr:uncharacterized protein MYCFIDRAFT_196816 [Pseudocercospora fijiensis CIRAD86]EME83586.1 hypothetical protein MYCFIDRAFT_196816 [Pseudocercospora fijiensis CIRAD86]